MQGRRWCEQDHANDSVESSTSSDRQQACIGQTPCSFEQRVSCCSNLSKFHPRASLRNSVRVRVSVMYFMAKWYIHTVWPPVPDQNVLSLSTISQSSTKFRKVPQKHKNSAETGTFHGSAQNSAFGGKWWSSRRYTWSALLLFIVLSAVLILHSVNFDDFAVSQVL